jgi:hypothetical protein
LSPLLLQRLQVWPFIHWVSTVHLPLNVIYVITNRIIVWQKYGEDLT